MFSGRAETPNSPKSQSSYSIYFGIIYAKIMKLNHAYPGYVSKLGIVIMLFPKVLKVT